MKRYAMIGVVLALAGCASSSGIVPMGPDTYFISEDTGFGATSVAKIKADAFREAAGFCAKERKNFRVINTNDVPFSFGHPAHAEVQFMCLNDGDPELTRPKMAKTPDTVIEMRK